MRIDRQEELTSVNHEKIVVDTPFNISFNGFN